MVKSTDVHAFGGGFSLTGNILFMQRMLNRPFLDVWTLRLCFQEFGELFFYLVTHPLNAHQIAVLHLCSGICLMPGNQKHVLPNDVSRAYIEPKIRTSLLRFSQNYEQIKIWCFVLWSANCSKTLQAIFKRMENKFPWSKAHVSLILAKSHRRFSYGTGNKCFHLFWTTLKYISHQ